MRSFLRPRRVIAGRGKGRVWMGFVVRGVWFKHLALLLFIFIFYLLTESAVC